MAMSPPRLKVGSNSFRTRKTSRSYSPGSCFGSYVHRPHLSAILSSREICAGAVVSVIEAQASRSGREHNAPLAMRRNKRRSLLRGSVHVGRDLLTMPMQLLRRIGVVEHVHRDLLTFLEPKQWPRELPIVGSDGNDSLRPDLNRRRFDVQCVFCGSGLAWRNHRFTVLNLLIRLSKNAFRAEQKSSGHNARGLQKSTARLCKVFH